PMCWRTAASRCPAPGPSCSPTIACGRPISGCSACPDIVRVGQLFVNKLDYAGFRSGVSAGGSGKGRLTEYGGAPSKLVHSGDHLMKLYFAPGACSLSPHIVLQEAGITAETEQVNNQEKKTKTGKDYWSVNPKGQVPALQLDSGEMLTEGPVIVQYLAD